MVGASLALGLAHTTLKVALVDAVALSDEFPALGNGVNDYDPRVSAIAPASAAFLEKLGAWPLIERQRISSYRAMHVWDAEGTAAVDFDARDVQCSSLGHIVENRLIAAALMRCLSTRPGVDIQAPRRLQKLERADAGYRLEFEDGGSLDAGLLVGADGANSLVRRLLNIHTREWDYGHRAIVCTVATERGNQATAWQRFLQSGPLAFLPLHNSDAGDRLSSIVWSLEEELAEPLMAMGAEEFNTALASAFEYRLGAVTDSSKRFAFPLRQRHAIDYFVDGAVLIGDAAHTIHPLAGQGVNLGFQDARVLAEELIRAHGRGVALADAAVLARYQRRRKADNLGMMAGMEAFKRLFASDSLAVRWARNWGMREFNRHSILKEQVIRRAMGL